MLDRNQPKHCSLPTKNIFYFSFSFSIGYLDKKNGGECYESCNILLFLSFFPQILFAQAPDTLWTKTFGGSGSDIGYSVQQTSDGGYIVAGYTSSFGAGLDDVWLIKTDANGDTLWTRTFGGNDHDEGYCVQQTSDGGYIITGKTDSFHTHSDVFLIKTDANGDEIWSRTYGTNNIYGIGYFVRQTSDGGYIITGRIWIPPNSSPDIWLIKTDSVGDTLWTRTFGENTLDYGKCVRQTTDGGFILTGETGLEDAFLIKTDARGDTLWTKRYYNYAQDWGHSVEQTTEGGYILTGKVSVIGGFHVWLMKTDANGDTLWTKKYGNGRDEGYSVQQTADGGYIVTGMIVEQGSNYFHVWLAKTDSNGDTLWTKTLGGSNFERGYAVQQTSDEGYILAGYTSSFGVGGNDVWLIRVDADPTSIGKNLQTTVGDYELQQNYPNPFNPTTTINYHLPVSGTVEITIYNLLGQQIRTLVSAQQAAGAHHVQWDGRDETGEPTTSGIYFYKLEAVNDFTETKKMVLLR